MRISWNFNYQEILGCSTRREQRN